MMETFLVGLVGLVKDQWAFITSGTANKTHGEALGLGGHEFGEAIRICCLMLFV